MDFDNQAITTDLFQCNLEIWWQKTDDNVRELVSKSTKWKLNSKMWRRGGAKMVS